MKLSPGPTWIWKGLVYLAVVLLALPVFAYQVPAVVGADESFVVLSGSMEPQFSAGDVIFGDHVPARQLEVGDVITYKKGPSFYTHRIVAINESSGERLFQTQGDANEGPDPWIVEEDDVVSRYSFHVPKYGFIMDFSRTTAGFVSFIIVPGLIVIALQVRTVIKTIQENERQKADKRLQEQLELMRAEQRAEQTGSESDSP